MNNRIVIVICFIAVATASVLGRFLYDEKQTQKLIIARLLEAETVAKDNLKTVHQRDDTAKALEKKLTQLTDVLNQTSTHLLLANQKIKEYEAKEAAELKAREAVTKHTEELARLKAQVPAPTVVASFDTAGKEIKTYHFSLLPGVNGQLLAANVDFGQAYGRRLVFRRSSGPPLAYDVDELHPGVLLHLNINPDDVKRAQAEQDKHNESIEVLHRQEIAVRAAAEQKAAEQMAKLQLEYAKLNEEKRKALADEQLKYRAAEIDRMKTEAAMRSADNAMQQALSAYSPDYVIEQYLLKLANQPNAGR